VRKGSANAKNHAVVVIVAPENAVTLAKMPASKIPNPAQISNALQALILPLIPLIPSIPKPAN
jgi:hypothetical protein